MKISEIDIKTAFEEALILQGVTTTIYKSGVPTAGMPDEYIELNQNGSIKSNATKLGILFGVILLTINVKLLSTGQRNSTMEAIIAGAFDSMFEDNKSVVNGKYHFSLDLNNLVYDGLSITENYSTKIINIKVSIY